MGGVGDLWGTGSAHLTLLGEWYPIPNMAGSGTYLLKGWGADLTYDPTLSGYASGIGGAFRGYTVGTWQGGTIGARALALYIDPAGRAGVLSGDLSGRYVQSGKSWELDGDVTTTFRETTTITPDQLAYSLSSGSFGSGYGTSADGSFAAGGTLQAGFLDGSLLGLTGHRWGIWSADLGGTFAGATGSAVTAKIGSGSFWLDPGPGVYESSGYLLGDLTVDDWGSAGSSFSGSADLSFLTDTRRGSLTGEVQGSFDTAGLWQGGALGTWETTPLKFAAHPNMDLSSFGFGVNGRWDYTDGSYYSYYYTSSTGNGSASYRRNDLGTGYEIYFFENGTTSTTDYVYGDPDNFGVIGWWPVGSPEYGTWDTSRPIGDQLSAPPDPTNAMQSPENRYPGLYSSGNLSGILGGIGALWTATAAAPAPVEFLGGYSLGLGGLFQGEVSSYNATNYTETTYDGGAFRGFLAGARAGNALDGRLTALYIDPEGNAGILQGSMRGSLYPELGLFEMKGGMSPLQIDAATGLTPDTLGGSISATSFQALASAGSFNGSGSIANAEIGENRMQSMTLTSLGNWGIGVNTFGGTYAGTSADSWNLPVEVGTYPLFSHSEVTGDLWSGGKLHGQALGYFTDYSPGVPVTGITVGETVGTFDPVAFTWQAVSAGAWFETGKFLDLASTPAGQALLGQLKIPAVEIGSASFAGAGTNGVDTLNVTMDNVKFFASRADTRPSLWASRSVGGTFTGAPAGVTVNLSQTAGANVSGLAPTMNVADWNGGGWRADVTASGGTVGGHHGDRHAGNGGRCLHRHRHGNHHRHRRRPGEVGRERLLRVDEQEGEAAASLFHFSVRCTTWRSSHSSTIEAVPGSRGRNS